MSALLQRFRQFDAQKFLNSFGTAGLYKRLAGGSQGLVAIFRSPDSDSQFPGLAVENTTPSLMFITDQLAGAAPVHGDTWTNEEDGVEWIVDSVDINPRPGFTRLNLSQA